MSEVSRILDQLRKGEADAADSLLPLVYDELRKLAAAQMANEAPGHTLEATALVHEAYMRLVGPLGDRRFANHRHFFAVAAESMRRILVDSARRKKAQKRGGAAKHHPLDPDRFEGPDVEMDCWIDLDAALSELETVDPAAAELAKFRIFGGLSVEEANDSLGISRATAF